MDRGGSAWNPSEKSKSNLGKSRLGTKSSKECCERISKALKGKKKSNSHYLSMCARLVKTYLFISPSGEYVTIVNMAQFCRENGLDDHGMRGVSRGEHSHHRGWKSQTPYVKKPSRSRQLLWLRSPSGEIIKFKSMRDARLKIKVSERILKEVAVGLRANCKGYTVANNDQL